MDHLESTFVYLDLLMETTKRPDMVYDRDDK